MPVTLFRENGTKDADTPLPVVAAHPVAAFLHPLDPLLCGMVVAGLGIEALCLYLGLSTEQLDDELVRLGLGRPQDRPIRRQGRAAWTTLDVMRLLAWRVSGVHPESIACRLGRSVSGVRSKARRLGVPVPSRKTLRRIDPAALIDPEPGWFYTLKPAFVITEQGADLFIVSDGVTWHPAAPSRPTPASSRRSRANPASQREMPFFGVVPAAPTSSPVNPVPVPGPVTAQASPTASTRPAAQAPAEPAVNADIAWIGRARRIGSNEDAVRAISLRYFGGQHPKFIARDANMSVSAVHAVLYRASIPRDRNRRKFGEGFDLEMAHATLEASGYVLVRDRTGVGREPGQGHLFWKHRTERGVTTTRAARLRNGIITEFDRYKSQEITLLTRADLDDPTLDWEDDADFDARRRPPTKTPEVPAPFAKRQGTMARSHTSSGARL